MVGSGEKAMRVPVAPASAADSGVVTIGSITSPCENRMRCNMPARRTSAVSESDRAFTTETPTP
eukprot:scaffold7963_cov116-Isochrysis_galbana.AAC.11